MIHYHGTPIGGKLTDAVEILRGRHALVSFAHTIQLNVVMDQCQSFVLDNGAFSEWRKTGGQVDFNAYHKWVHELYLHPGFDWCLIPDVIGGEEQENKDLVTRWLDSEAKAKSVPVYHLHESMEWLDYLVSNFEWVALGSSGQWPTPGTDSWWERMSEVMDVCCDNQGRPRCKLHGLRMLDPNVFQHIPLSGADSTNAARNNNQLKRFGMYPPPTAGQRAATIASRVENYNSAPVWIRSKQEGFSFDD